MLTELTNEARLHIIATLFDSASHPLHKTKHVAASDRCNECALLEPIHFVMDPRIELIESGCRPGPELCDSINLSRDFVCRECLQLLCAQKLYRSLSIFKIMKLTSTHTTKKISLRVVASAVCAHVSINDYKNRCPVIFEQKTTQKPLPGGLLENQNHPALRPGFDHFLSYFSSVQKEKSVFWTIFSGILGTPPWPSKNRFFDTFFIKIEKWNLFDATHLRCS